jgi:hypothetical protein
MFVTQPARQGRDEEPDRRQVNHGESLMQDHATTGTVRSAQLRDNTGHAEVHKTVFRNSIQRERLEELTFVGSDAAVVRFYSTLTGDERAPGKTIRSRKILIVTKRAGAWKVGWGQNTRLADSTPE